MQLLEQLTGDKLETCPWAGFHDPFVVSVLEASQWFEKNQLAIYWPKPTHLHVQALGHYQRALNRIQSDDMKRRARDVERQARHG